MSMDAQMAVGFYATPRGAMVARLLRERLGALWPSMAARSVLGLGYAVPYLRLWREQAGRCIALTPAQLAPVRWPAGLANLSCAGQEDALPFPDLSFDRVLVVHGLEGADNARRLLREVWRVLKDDGRLLVVAPNRRGMWAYMESTPFGHGQPYSTGQVSRLLTAALFRIERRDAVLFMPPVRLRPVLRSARLLERGARRMLPPAMAGLTIIEASKDIYAVLPTSVRPRRRVVLAELG
jgi:SAM-dependent methyltransferase